MRSKGTKMRSGGGRDGYPEGARCGLVQRPALEVDFPAVQLLGPAQLPPRPFTPASIADSPQAMTESMVNSRQSKFVCISEAMFTLAEKVQLDCNLESA